MGASARTYIHQLYVDTGCSLEDQAEAMDSGTDDERKSGNSMLSAQYDDDDLK